MISTNLFKGTAQGNKQVSRNEVGLVKKKQIHSSLRHIILNIITKYIYYLDIYLLSSPNHSNLILSTGLTRTLN